MATFIELTQYQLIEAVGADAEKFLQGQLTCDVAKLAAGSSTLAAHCDPKGKMTSIFRLIRGNETSNGEQQFFLLIKKALLPLALDSLKKYAVFSKITFQPLDWQIVGFLGEKCGQLSAQSFIDLENRGILLNPTALAVSFNGTPAQWEQAEIQAGIPSLFANTQNEFIPQALNLQLIEQAISFSKGCYIGQETVARAKYRGANKRAMFVFKARTAYTPEIGSEIEKQLETNWRKTGSIVNAVNIDDELWLQVVMNNEIEDGEKFRLNEETELTLCAVPYLL